MIARLLQIVGEVSKPVRKTAALLDKNFRLKSDTWCDVCDLKKSDRCLYCGKDSKDLL